MTSRRYLTPDAFKQALETRLRSAATQQGISMNRMRQRLIFERFLVRVFAVLGERALLKGGVALESTADFCVQRSRRRSPSEARIHSPARCHHRQPSGPIGTHAWHKIMVCPGPRSRTSTAPRAPSSIRSWAVAGRCGNPIAGPGSDAFCGCSTARAEEGEVGLRAHPRARAAYVPSSPSEPGEGSFAEGLPPTASPENGRKRSTVRP